MNDAKPQPQTFVRRRDIWMQHVCGPCGLTMAARVVGCHLALRMNAKKPYCWPNIKTMAKTLDLSFRHAQRSMLELEKAGLLIVSRKRGEGNYYSLRLPSDP